MKSYIKHNNIKYTDNWSTPKEIYEYYVNQKKYYDPCPLYADNFDFSFQNKPLFINPPYSDIEKWVKWSITNHILSKKTYCIINSIKNRY